MSLPPTMLDTPCIETTWRRNAKGYGQGWVRIEGRWANIRAHRWAWEQMHGPIPAGLCVLHRCDNPPCINVDHLFLGTRTDNNIDMVAKARTAHGMRNGMVLHPDRRPRGDRNGSHLHPESRPRGERNPLAKLTADQVQTLRSLDYGIETQTEVAKRYGISRATLRSILLRCSWAWLP